MISKTAINDVPPALGHYLSNDLLLGINKKYQFLSK